MENLSTMTTALESALSDLKDLIGSQTKSAKRTGLIVGGGYVLTVLSIFSLPKWISGVLVAMLFGYSLSESKKRLSLLGKKLAEIQGLLNDASLQTKNACDDSFESDNKIQQEKDAEIDTLKSTIEELKSQINESTSCAPVTKDDWDKISIEKSILETNFKETLKKIQSLDIEVDDFGPECADYMRKEFKKTLRACGLEILDYTPDNQEMFSIETATISDVDCTARAIVTTSKPRMVIIKGHVFVPQTK